MTVTTPRVLVVSESRITRRVVEMTFADQKVDLVSAASGAEGLAAWDEQPASVVIADLTMEAPDGLALARHLAERTGDRAPAVLLMAGQGEHVDDAAMASAGVRAVLRKPLDSLQLVEAVRAATRGGRPADVAAPPPAAVEPPVVIASDPVEVVATDAPAMPPFDLSDEDLERVAARVAAIWSGDAGREQRVTALLTERAEQMAATEAVAAMERVAPAAASAAAERLVRELAPKLVAEVTKLVVADVSERLVREEIARMRATPPAR